MGGKATLPEGHAFTRAVIAHLLFVIPQRSRARANAEESAFGIALSVKIRSIRVHPC